MMFRRFALLTTPFVAAALTATSANAASLSLHLAPDAAPEKPVACPFGSPAEATCDALSGSGTERGLGRYSAAATVVITQRPGGGFASTVTGAVTTAKGSVAIAGDNSSDPRGSLEYTVTLTGAGGYTSAAGTGTFNYIGALHGSGAFILDATIAPGNVAFDLSPPTVAIRKATARALGHGRYVVTVRYTAKDDSAGALTASLFRAGAANPIASGPATGVEKASVKVVARRLSLRLAVTDSSANTATRTIVVALR